MIVLTAPQLQAILPLTRRAHLFVEPLNMTMQRFHIAENAQRVASFIAQVGHESAQLAYTRELWNPKRCVWQARYEGRADLGNTKPGDGERYMGRGLIQLTGRANYTEASIFFNVDFVSHPELVEQPLHAAMTAGWFWDSRALNPLADAGDFEKITRRINGGINGMPDRLEHYRRAQQVLMQQAAA